ncbi:ECF transporter S component [Paenibacillus sp. 2TAB23]|uniref:ECF transporter S component n=1 Tax=Paenibacillus sp. 2TAB23 TaxID=3233004 RepID=UPI003F9E0A1D
MPEKPLAGTRLSRRTWLAAVLILVVIPATIVFGIVVLDDRKYYFISLLIVLYTMLPFALVFEKRKPQARELIVIAVLAAIAVAGRSAFFMLPQFKPVVAIVIIAGVSFGAEAGFLVGATAGFVSNFFFGQGPWTPWQMFCFGIIGFLAGILFQKGLLKKTKLSLCVFGGLSTFFVYGGIINAGSVTMFSSEFSWKALAASYVSGFWFDIVHASATVLFLFVLARPMLEKLDRIKTKYGLIEPGGK